MMNATRSLHHRCVRCALAIGSLSLIVAVVAGGEKAKDPAEEKVAKRDAKEAAKMVDAIVNRNKPPEIITSGGRPPSGPSKFPLFPKDYDWKEEGRVREALHELYQDTSGELWEALVQKAEDRRYCVVLYSGNTSDARIVTVGGICYGLAYSRLCEVFAQHLPSLPPHGCPIHLHISDLSAWRKERKDKPVYQLQIEACETALHKLPEVHKLILSDKEKAAAQKEIEAEIAKLRRTKQPFLGEPAKGFIAAYPRREAERVREAHEKGPLEEFRSGLNR